MMDSDARHRLAGMGLIAGAVFGFASIGLAQEVPEGQSCGGLVCDLGLFGHKGASKPSTALPSPAVVAPVPAPQRAAGTPEPAPEPKRLAHKKTHVAKAIAVKPGRAVSPSSTSGGSASAFGTPPVASSLVPAQAPAPSPVAAALVPPPARAMGAPPPAPIPVTATPARDEPVVLANPYVYSKPLKFMFQSVDPTQGVQ